MYNDQRNIIDINVYWLRGKWCQVVFSEFLQHFTLSLCLFKLCQFQIRRKHFVKVASFGRHSELAIYILINIHGFRYCKIMRDLFMWLIKGINQPHNNYPVWTTNLKCFKNVRNKFEFYFNHKILTSNCDLTWIYIYWGKG